METTLKRLHTAWFQLHSIYSKDSKRIRHYQRLAKQGDERVLAHGLLSIKGSDGILNDIIRVDKNELSAKQTKL